MDKVSYALGLGIGQQLAQMGASDLNIDDFADAIKDVINGNVLKVPHKDAQTIVQEYFRQQEERINAIRAEQGKAAKAEGEKFLAENGKKEGVVTLKSGLQYEVLREGNGKKPKATDQVKCHYEGTLINGQVFDSSYKRNEPAVFPLNQVIPGSTRPATHAGGSEVSFLYPLYPRLRRERSRRFYPSIRNAHLRR